MILRATDMRDPRRTLKIGRRASRTAHRRRASVR
ncbi:DUF1534 domain-containing protein [Pseudomonas syringae pv. theae]|nr:DUF1534 domain-containing protein [Pseudomonas syringae pv. theae]MBL3870182.1 DUF1534 domain-containing protein [Pseudomonas syringae pv. theae]MBL3875887.1 DUF1534 domain-containing protein [Pseudomonas syringae pv. theae]